MKKARTGLGVALGALLLLFSVTLAGQGPAPAQIQAAIRALLAGNNTWTGTNSFQAITVTSCTGCAGAGTITGSLTSGRIPFASGTTTLTDSANLTWDGTTLSALHCDGCMTGSLDDVDAGDYPTPVLAGAGAGNVSNGTHRYKFVLTDGFTRHTGGSGTATAAVTVADNTANGKVTVKIPFAFNGPFAYIEIYRDKNSDGVYKLVDTVEWTEEITFTDNVADGSLGATIPSTNTSTGGFALDSGNLQGADPDATWITNLSPNGLLINVDAQKQPGTHGGALQLAAGVVPNASDVFADTYFASFLNLNGGYETPSSAIFNGSTVYLSSGKNTDGDGGNVLIGGSEPNSGRTAGALYLGLHGAPFANIYVNQVPAVTTTGFTQGILTGLDVALGDVAIANGKALKTDTTTAHTALLQAYDVNGTAYKTFGTLTNGDTPDFTITPPSGGTVTVQATTLGVSGLTTPTNKPVCFDASGNLYAGTNTAGVLSCP